MFISINLRDKSHHPFAGVPIKAKALVALKELIAYKKF